MKQLDPKAVWLFFINSISGFFFMVVILSFWGIGGLTSLDIDSGTGLMSLAINSIVVIIIVGLILSYIWARLTYRFYKYELREDGFRKELGVIYKQYVTIPYDRIQNVDIYRGIIARLLGLSDLNIQTAGSSAGMMRGEGRLPGLSKEVAEELRDEIIKRSRSSRNGQGL